jgi:hypothetical protein
MPGVQEEGLSSTTLTQRTTTATTTTTTPATSSSQSSSLPSSMPQTGVLMGLNVSLLECLFVLMEFIFGTVIFPAIWRLALQYPCSKLYDQVTCDEIYRILGYFSIAYWLLNRLSWTGFTNLDGIKSLLNLTFNPYLGLSTFFTKENIPEQSETDGGKVGAGDLGSKKKTTKGAKIFGYFLLAHIISIAIMLTLQFTTNTQLYTLDNFYVVESSTSATPNIDAMLVDKQPIVALTQGDQITTTAIPETVDPTTNTIPSLISTTTTALRRSYTKMPSQYATTHQQRQQHQSFFTKSPSAFPTPRPAITTTSPIIPTRPTTIQQRRKNSRRQNSDDDDGDMEMPKGPQQQGQKDQKGSRGPRPQQVEAETHRHKSSAILPEHLRGKGFTFRKGLAVPKINNNHWLNKVVIEPYIALKGNMLVWWDTQIRFTRLGFVMLHLSSLIAAGLLSWKAQDYYWVDYEDNMDRARHLYMIDVARLLWLQTAKKRCELVIQQRKNGVIPGLLVPEALRSEKESPFRTTSYRHHHDISDRIEKWNSEYGEEEEMKKRFRREMWGDWDSRNRFNIYNAINYLLSHNFTEASPLMLNSIQTFASTDILNIDSAMILATYLSIIRCPRKDLVSKVVESPEIIQTLLANQVERDFLDHIYNCRYTPFSHLLPAVQDRLLRSPFLASLAPNYLKEARLVAYRQFLQSFQYVKIDAFAQSFGVSADFIEKDVANLISAGRLEARINLVDNIIEMSHTKNKMSQFEQVLVTADVVVNKLNKFTQQAKAL